MDSSTKEDKGFFFVCYFSICLIGLLPIYTVLSLSTANGSQVKATIRDLYAPIITYDSTRNFLTIPSIFFFLSLHDNTDQLDVYYDDITLKFYHVDSINPSNIPIADYTLPGFYQKGDTHGSVAERYDHVKTQGISLDEVSEDASEIVVRVNLVTAVTFQYLWWKGKKHKLLVGADVKMSTITGKKVETGGLELRPYTEHGSGGHYRKVVVFCFFYPFLSFIICIILVTQTDGKDRPRHKLSTAIPEDRKRSQIE